MAYLFSKLLRCVRSLTLINGPLRGLLALSLLCLQSCGGGGGGATSSIAPLGGGLVPGQVQEVVFDSEDKALLHFDELSGTELFSVLVFSPNTLTQNFNIQLTGDNETQNKFLEVPLFGDDLQASGSAEDFDDPNALFHEILRLREAQLAKQLRSSWGSKNLAEMTSGSSSLEAQDIPCGNGAGIVLKVLNSLSTTDTYDSTCAIEKRTTQNAIYYVDQQIESLIPTDSLKEIIDNFERQIPLERDIVGDESDVNGDGKFCVYFTPSVNQLGAAAGGFVTGYFYGGDLFPQSSIPASNERECLYILTPDPNGNWGTPLSVGFWQSNIANTVLPHEFQHMINFHYKALQAEVGAEESWANEGLSHLMEDLDPEKELSHISPENPSRVALFLKTPWSAPFTAGTSLAQRGGAYLFFRYLCEQSENQRYTGLSGCRDLLRSLIQSPGKGIVNIESVTGASFKNLLLDFYATLQLSHTGITQDPRYNFATLCLTCAQDDNRGTVLNGVSNQVFNSIPNTGSLTSPGGLFLQIDGKVISNSGNDLYLYTTPGMNAAGAIIRLQ